MSSSEPETVGEDGDGDDDDEDDDDEGNGPCGAGLGGFDNGWAGCSGELEGERAKSRDKGFDII